MTMLRLMQILRQRQSQHLRQLQKLKQVLAATVVPKTSWQ
jgi:hypothetical protein